jgi:hypothetical protein
MCHTDTILQTNYAKYIESEMCHTDQGVYDFDELSAQSNKKLSRDDSEIVPLKTIYI